MPDYQALNPQQHANLSWNRYSSYQFAQNDAVAPLVAQELPKACVHLPIAFMPTPEGTITTVALLGLKPQENLVVTSQGHWSLGYIPATYRSYPFKLLPTTEGGYVLCVDTTSGLLGPEGEALFDASQQPTPAIQEVLGFLQQVAHNAVVTQQLCQQLHSHQLLEPWPLQITTPQGQQQLQGLLRINEAALQQLDANTLHSLQQSSALQMAYMQLLSMQHVSQLAQLAQARHHQAQQQTLAEQSLQTNSELDLEFLNQGGTLTFSNL